MEICFAIVDDQGWLGQINAFTSKRVGDDRKSPARFIFSPSGPRPARRPKQASAEERALQGKFEIDHSREWKG